MCLDSRYQQFRIAWPLGEDFVMCDDLVLGFLDLHQVSELVGPIGFAFANDLTVRFKHTHQLFRVEVTIEDPRFGLPNYLLHSANHGPNSARSALTLGRRRVLTSSITRFA